MKLFRRSEATAVDVILSRGEFLLVAGLMGRPNVVGFPARSEAGAAADERAAAQSLLTRRLAVVDEQGKPKVDRRVLDVVRATAFAEKTFLAHRITPDGRVFSLTISVAGQAAVARRPTDAEHYRFTLLNGAANVGAALERFCMSDDTRITGQGYRLSLSERGLEAARTASLGGDVGRAQAELVRQGVDAATAGALAAFFARPHTLNALQAVSSSGARRSARSATIASGGGSAWLMLEAPGSNGAEPRCAISAVSSEGLRQFIDAFVAG